MNHLNLSRCAVGVCVAAVSLGACGSQGLIGAPGRNTTLVTAPITRAAGGGAFSGGYSGKHGFQRCIYVAGPKEGLFGYTGKGTVSFLGPSSESGQLVSENVSHQCLPWSGTATLTSSKNSKNSILVQLSGGSYSEPCGHSFLYTVTGGTGKFVGATGAGTVSFSCAPGHHRRSQSTYTDQWLGTLHW